MNFASGPRELINEAPELYQGLHVDAWLVAHDDPRASDLLEHPDRDHDSQFLLVGALVVPFDPHQHRRVTAVASASQDGYIVIEKRVKTIRDFRRTKLAGSVWIRCAIPLPRNCYSLDTISAPCRNYLDMRTSAQP